MRGSLSDQSAELVETVGFAHEDNVVRVAFHGTKAEAPRINLSNSLPAWGLLHASGQVSLGHALIVPNGWSAWGRSSGSLLAALNVWSPGVGESAWRRKHLKLHPHEVEAAGVRSRRSARLMRTASGS